MNWLNTWFVFRLCGGAVGLACRLLEDRLCCMWPKRGDSFSYGRLLPGVFDSRVRELQVSLSVCVCVCVGVLCWWLVSIYRKCIGVM